MNCKCCHANTEGDFCNDACKNEYDDFFASDEKRRTCYWIGFIISIMFMTFGLMHLNIAIVSIGTFIAGITSIAFPYTSEPRIRNMGLKKTLTLARTIGTIMIVIGAILIIVEVLIRA